METLPQGTRLASVETLPHLEAAKERERARKGNQPGASKETLPYLDAGQSRDKAGERVGLPSKDRIIMHIGRIEQRAVQTHDDPATRTPAVPVLLADDLDPDDTTPPNGSAILERYAIADPSD